MSGDDALRARTGGIALAVTLAIQMFTSLAATSTAVLAPAIARDLGIAPTLIGVFVGLVYLGSMGASLLCGGFIERYGAIRVSQACVLLCAAGVAMVAGMPSAFVAVFAVAPVVLGLGYGPITPASSQILARTAPPSRMALTFSIKQTGVPAGAALAGAALPGLSLLLDWRTTLAAVALIGVVVAFAAQPMRATLDADRRPGRSLSLSGVFAPLKIVLANRALIELTGIGFVYAAMQVCLMSFLVVYLTETLGSSLVAAGLTLTTANIGGIVGRIGWGAIADRFIRPRTLLGSIGIATGVCAYATAAFDTGWPTALLLAVSAIFGATAIGWNGVQLAEVARHSPKGRAGMITGASGFITFAGVVLGPPTFALLAALTSSYRVGFVVFGSLTLACGTLLLFRKNM